MKICLQRPIAALLAAGFATQIAACGTLLYPERRGQRIGKLDTEIVLLDATGLIIGIVPGLVAFAIDLTTGAIYLPEERSRRARGIFGELRIRRVPLTGNTLADAETALEAGAAVDVDLGDPLIRWIRPEGREPIEDELLARNRVLETTAISRKMPRR